jgi:hypothetical protein
MRVAAALFAIAAAPLFGADVYFNDFNGPVGTTCPEWTSSGYIYSSNKAGTVAA